MTSQWNGKQEFDYQAFRKQAIERMLAGDKELGGKDGVLAPLLKDLLDAAASAFRFEPLYDSKNILSCKTLKMRESQCQWGYPTVFG